MGVWQRSLLDPGDSIVVPADVPPDLDPTVSPVLGDGAWIEFHPGWLGRHDLLFDELVASVPWREERRIMYDRTVAVPRLLALYDEDAVLPHPALTDIRDALGRAYGHRGAGPLRTTGICRYRDHRDSVAWHGDRIGRSTTEATVVAIVSLGAHRRFLLRPAGGGGPSYRFDVGAGDLLVMGGTCQRTYRHAVPKSAKPCGPRISIQFRTRPPSADAGVTGVPSG